MQQGSTSYPAAFICLVINILRPSPVLPFTVHTCKVRTRIRRNTIIVLHVDRIMRTARLIYSMLILAVQHVLACVNAHPVHARYVSLSRRCTASSFCSIACFAGPCTVKPINSGRANWHINSILGSCFHK